MLLTAPPAQSLPTLKARFRTGERLLSNSVYANFAGMTVSVKTIQAASDTLEEIVHANVRTASNLQWVRRDASAPRRSD